MYLVASIFLLLSGAAALTYQVTWVRLLGLSMGSTTAAVSTVVAVFFLGMALGSYFAGRISKNHTNSLFVYVVLECCIGISGLILLPILLNLDNIIATIPALSSILAGKFLITSALLLIPTLCMGATFPVMAAILVRKENELGKRIGQLYSLNTFGAIAGALLTGFVFIPSVGLDGAIYIAVICNLSIAAMGWLYSKNCHLPEMEFNQKESSQDQPLSKIDYGKTSALIILMGTGFASIASEIGWTKYLSIFTGTTIYGFSAILGIFLMGIASGSWAIKNHLEKIKNPHLWLISLLILAGFGLLYARTGMASIPIWYEGINSTSLSGNSKQWLTYMLVFVVIFPPTFIFGAIFPLNVKLFCGDLRGVQSRVGKAYAANTVASIAGSLAAGFWLIPKFGTDSLLQLMIFAIFLLPIVVILQSDSRNKKIFVTTSCITLILFSTLFPSIDYKKLITSVAQNYEGGFDKGDMPEFLFLKEGKVSVISLVTYDNKNAKVLANGLNESYIDMEDPSKSLIIESLLAYMPYFLHNDPKSAFVVGYGGGITTRAFSHTTIEKIKVVELESAVIDASKQISNGPITALQDPRVTLEINDARNSLLVNDTRYDIIAAQASHPWLAGAANVFTQDFFQLVFNRLNDDGIYSQWVNLFRMDVTTLRSLMKAFYNVFPEGMTLANLKSGDFMMIGSKKTIMLDFEKIASAMKLKPIKAALAHEDIYAPGDLLWYFALSREEAVKAAGNITPNTDTNIFSEVRLSALYDNPTEQENPYGFLRKHYKFDVIPYLEEKSAADKLLRVGNYFLKWESPDVAFKIVTQLKNLDPVASRSMHHRILRWKFNWIKASKFYHNNGIWSDQTHLKQLEYYLDNKEWQLASDIIQSISDQKTKRTALAMELFYKNQWQTLADLEPKSIAERKWQLLGLSKFDLDAAGKEMEILIQNDSKELPPIRMLIQYFVHINDADKADKWSRQLAAVTNDRLQRYVKLADISLNQNNLDWNAALIGEISRIDPDHKELDLLKLKRTNKLANN